MECYDQMSKLGEKKHPKRLYSHITSVSNMQHDGNQCNFGIYLDRLILFHEV